ncbi:hypothetical protein Pyn_33070 [Prunus yedoensis var. nudiflora]|uniref:Uncharacterized protein n=1 Tax=Prunus yedoensis var. nudiflora TaxID=2094558 RepID=A0A314YDN8_PRUYE|nr:hypothetical protein Pyn_33070 [Prunus yedoensis var. nudiflora]
MYMEETWDAGLFARPKDIGTNIQEEAATNHCTQEESEEVGESKGARLSDENGRLWVGIVDHDILSIEYGDNTILGHPSQMALGNEQVNLTQGLDPFNLGPII